MHTELSGVMRLFIAAVPLCMMADVPTSAREPLPWAYIQGSADGYSIKLQAATPQPGTELRAGQAVDFIVLISSELSLKDEADILLAAESEANQKPDWDAALQRIHVTPGERSVTFEHMIAVPSGSKELRLFITLQPTGAERIAEVLVLRYPIGAAAKSTSIGYPSAAAALADLRSKPDVAFRVQRGWITASDVEHDTLWSFAAPGSAAYPTAVKRVVVQTRGNISIDMAILCQAVQSACDKVMADFQALNNQIRSTARH
jgi:hypothetical protein